MSLNDIFAGLYQTNGRRPPLALQRSSNRSPPQPDDPTWIALLRQHDLVIAKPDVYETLGCPQEVAAVLTDYPLPPLLRRIYEGMEVDHDSNTYIIPDSLRASMARTLMEIYHELHPLHQTNLSIAFKKGPHQGQPLSQVMLERLIDHPYLLAPFLYPRDSLESIAAHHHGAWIHRAPHPLEHKAFEDEFTLTFAYVCDFTPNPINLKTLRQRTQPQRRVLNGADLAYLSHHWKPKFCNNPLQATAQSLHRLLHLIYTRLPDHLDTFLPPALYHAPPASATSTNTDPDTPTPTTAAPASERNVSPASSTSSSANQTSSSASSRNRKRSTTAANDNNNKPAQQNSPPQKVTQNKTNPESNGSRKKPRTSPVTQMSPKALFEKESMSTTAKSAPTKDPLETCPFINTGNSTTNTLSK
mmetsp:Transcript_6110/g.10519  ORF Transcript_6110/g.10519 Transcript_6110/m.10519 type:complete len:415 (-) Transcript_6110:201-1445(-)